MEKKLQSLEIGKADPERSDVPFGVLPDRFVRFHENQPKVNAARIHRLQRSTRYLEGKINPKSSPALNPFCRPHINYLEVKIK
jgi:hypothetical protein